MKIANNKTMSAMIALFLMLTITATLVVLPIGNAHVPAWTFPTSAYVAVTPNPIGVGQYVNIVFWVDRYDPTSGGTQGQRWTGYKVVITKPDGTNETLGPYTCPSAVGAMGITYTPDQVGTYTIVFSWPGQTVEYAPGANRLTSNVGDYYAGSTSAPAKLIVQKEQIKSWQEPPLPTDYWTTPINAANREWSPLASNWLKGTWLVDNFQSAGQAPESPHVVWTKPITAARAGGINDASWPGQPSDVNDYENPWSAPIVMNGKIYYNKPPVADSAAYGYYCVDLYTGEEIWYKNGTDNGLNNPSAIASDIHTQSGGKSYTLWRTFASLTQGQLLHYNSVNGQGILSYLIMVQGTTWYFLDAATGNWMLTLINVPSGTAATDQDGNLLLYRYNSTSGNLLCWNSSQSIPPQAPMGSSQQQWKMRPQSTIDAVNDTSWTAVGPAGDITTDQIAPRSGYTMNITVPKNLPGNIDVLKDDKRVPKMIFGSQIRVDGATSGSPSNSDIFSAWALSIDEHVTGFTPFPNESATQNTNLGFGATLKWSKDITVPLPGKNYTWSIGGVSYADQVFMLLCKQTSQLWAYSLTTGERLWGPTTSFSQWDFYSLNSAMYYGKVFACSQYGGELAAYDAKTGKLLWVYNATAPGYESAYGPNMPLSITAVCDGKIYLHSTEHSPTKPLWRASYLRCINATDGTEMWKLLDFNMGASIADGYIVTGNLYDNNIYCIGKGPSATTVEAPMTAITAGDSIVISGTVTDQSPGAKGTPAIAEASMQAWMEYLYEQQAMPTNATGVPVALDAVDPNSNFIHIGTTTSDISGTFGYAWTPPDVPGTYKIIATFAGSKSYGSSSATTYSVVTSAPATPAPTATSLSAATIESSIMTYTAVAAIAIIIAIAVVGFLILKKRP